MSVASFLERLVRFRPALYSHHDRGRPRSDTFGPTIDLQNSTVHGVDNRKLASNNLSGSTRLFGTAVTSTSRHNGCGHCRPSLNSIGAEGGAERLQVATYALRV